MHVRAVAEVLAAVDVHTLVVAVVTVIVRAVAEVLVAADVLTLAVAVVIVAVLQVVQAVQMPARADKNQLYE